jgi:aryl-alcohol dehydrogenase-like predicted oxidoreductase
MIFGEQTERGTDEPTALRMIDRYLDAGGNFIDTADVYAQGRSEEIVGKAIADKQRDQLMLATKVRMPTGPGPNDVGLSRKHITDSIDASLKRLGTDYLDLYYVHMWDPYTPIAETLRTLDDLVSEGKVRYIGVSNFKAWQVMKGLAVSEARGYPRFVAGQFQHSLVTRDIEDEYDELFASEGIGEIPWGALGGGFLSGKYKRGERPTEGRVSMMPDRAPESWAHRNTERNWDIIDAVGKIAEERGATYSQVALAWLLKRPQTASVLLGARTPEQLEDNLGAAELELSDEEFASLNEASTPPERYPYHMMRNVMGSAAR